MRCKTVHGALFGRWREKWPLVKDQQVGRREAFLYFFWKRPIDAQYAAHGTQVADNSPAGLPAEALMAAVDSCK